MAPCHRMPGNNNISSKHNDMDTSLVIFVAHIHWGFDPSHLQTKKHAQDIMRAL